MGGNIYENKTYRYGKVNNKKKPQPKKEGVYEFYKCHKIEEIKSFFFCDAFEVKRIDFKWIEKVT